MLGQEISFDVCVLDYFDQPTKATQFMITGISHKDYRISGPTSAWIVNLYECILFLFREFGSLWHIAIVNED